MVAYPSDWEIITPFFTMHDSKRVPVAEGERPVGNTPYYGANGIQGYIKGFTHSGEFVLIAEDGACDIYNYPVKYVSGDIWVNNHAHVIQGIEGISDTKFLSYALANYDFTPILVGGTRVKLNGKALQNITIELPLFKEQKAIADTLSTFDEHIENLTKLIEKKKAIRDGALGDLVTGKTRLDGFDSEWKCSRLDKLTKQIITGGTPSTAEDKYWDGEIPWLSSTEIHQKRITSPTSYITEVGLNNSSAKMAPPCSVVVALAGQGKTRGTAAILEKEMALNQSLAAIVVNDGTDFTFLYYALEKSYEALRELSSGDGGRGGLNKKILKEFEIKVPTSKKEQQAIASILNVMDEEISVLVEEKNKIAQLKEGAMDDLLTGRVRLV
jgi:type I restriction enzyme S subunit